MQICCHWMYKRSFDSVHALAEIAASRRWSGLKGFHSYIHVHQMNLPKGQYHYMNCVQIRAKHKRVLSPDFLQLSIQTEFIVMQSTCEDFAQLNIRWAQSAVHSCLHRGCQRSMASILGPLTVWAILCHSIKASMWQSFRLSLRFLVLWRRIPCPWFPGWSRQPRVCRNRDIFCTHVPSVRSPWTVSP